MKLREALKRLEAAGTAQNRKVYARHGVKGPCFGVSQADLGKLEKEIGVDHELALTLWKNGNHDARVLATRIADPARVTPLLLEDWARALEDYVLTDALVKLGARTDAAAALVPIWTRSADPWLGTAGWTMLAARVEREDAPDDRQLARALSAIEGGTHEAPNRTRYAMNLALIAIGAARPGLRAAALSAAKRIGKVEVDHGETGCKTPDAAAYIRKVVQHRKKADRPSSGTRPKARPRGRRGRATTSG